MSDALEHLNGSTVLFAVIGDPIKQVKVTAPLTTILVARKRNAIVVPMQIAAEHVADSFRMLRAMPNFGGMIITIPHKTAMAGLVDTLSERAQLSGAINICARQANGQWHGDILDGFGFAEGLAHHGFAIAQSKALVIGVGGAGSAVAAELAIRGASVYLFDTDHARARRLAERLTAAGYVADYSAIADPKGFDLVANASPVGMGSDHRIPLDASLLDPSIRVADLVMSPRETPLIKAAIEAGCPVNYGSDVMNFQLEAMATFFANAKAG